MTKQENIILALAGIFQSAALVNEIANHGNCEGNTFATSINSIYKIDSASTVDVFSGVAGVRFGLVQLERLLANNKDFPPNIMRYVIGLLYIEKHLRKSKQLGAELANRLKSVNRQLDYYAPLDAPLIDNLASIYNDIFAQLSYRIQVIGKRQYLTADDLIAKVRAVLLAGIRAAVLWRQLGGNRWQLLFKRNSMERSVKTLLANV